MSRLQLVDANGAHQFKERDGVLPGVPGAVCRHCGEESSAHIARQCAGGVSGIGPRCDADAAYLLQWGARQVPFCVACAGKVIDLADLTGLPIVLEPMKGGHA